MGENTGRPPEKADPSAARDARHLIRTSLKGALATFDATPANGIATPYASLVTTATNAAGAPTLLISKLARHTKNLEANPTASVMIDGTSATGDPLAGGRITVIGSFAPSSDPDVKTRFLSRHPESQMYASFADFNFYEMEVTCAHFIGGFGRIVDLECADLFVDLTGAIDLIAAQADIIAHMNEDHADTLLLYATKLLGEDPDAGPWRMSGIDPQGIDIIAPEKGLRIDFDNRITSPNMARMAFKALAQRARDIV